MVNIKTVAELAWRQLFPQPSDETPVSLEELVEAAKGKYARMIYQDFQRADPMDRPQLDGAMVRWVLPVTGGEARLPARVLMLPGDGGLRSVSVQGRVLTRSYALNRHLFAHDIGEPSYYRLAGSLFFSHPATEAVVLALPYDSIMEDMEIPSAYADGIHAELVALYGGTRNIPVDETNNANAEA